MQEIKVLLRNEAGELYTALLERSVTIVAGKFLNREMASKTELSSSSS